MRARWAPPKSRSNEATGHLVDLIYAPFIVIGEEKKKKESWALASARAARRCSNIGTQPSICLRWACKCIQCTGPGQCTSACRAALHTCDSAGRLLRYAARCRFRIPPCPNVASHCFQTHADSNRPDLRAQRCVQWHWPSGCGWTTNYHRPDGWRRPSPGKCCSPNPFGLPVQHQNAAERHGRRWHYWAGERANGVDPPTRRHRQEKFNSKEDDSWCEETQWPGSSPYPFHDDTPRGAFCHWNCNFFTSLYAHNGCWQIPLSKGSKTPTTFITLLPVPVSSQPPGPHFRWRRVQSPHWCCFIVGNCRHLLWD